MGLFNWFAGIEDSDERGSNHAERDYRLGVDRDEEEIKGIAKQNEHPYVFYEAYVGEWNRCVDYDEPKPWWKIW